MRAQLLHIPYSYTLGAYYLHYMNRLARKIVSKQHETLFFRLLRAYSKTF